MSHPIKPTDWHNTIAPTRALLHAVEEPFAALWELFQANEHALTALEPSLGVVDFAPFAQLAVSDTDPQPAQARPAPRRSSVYSAATPPLPTVGPPSIAASAPAARFGETIATKSNLAKADATPVFALPGRKSTSAALPPATSGHATAAPLVSTAHHAANPASAQRPTQEAIQIERADDQPTMTQPTMTQPTPPLAQAIIADGGGNQDVSVATMVRLATLTETLLILPDPNGPVVSGGAPLPGGRSHPFAVPHTSQAQSVGPPLTGGVPGQADPAPLFAFAEGHADQTLVSQSLVPATRIASPLMPAEVLPRASVDDGWLTASTPITAASSSQPDGWTLAQLINDVLAEEARRHGVDLS